MDKKIGKVPPHSLEAEKSVLGAAMISKEALIDILDALIGEDFYNKAHREIFQSIATLLASTFAGLIWYYGAPWLVFVISGTVTALVAFYFWMDAGKE